MELIKNYEMVKYQFYTMPKQLFTNQIYKGLSLEAKMIYSLFIDRLELSKKNDWKNEKGEVYLIFKRSEIGDILSLSDKTVTKAIKELKDIKLIFESRRGLGKPNLIYIGKLKLENQEEENIPFITEKNYEIEGRKINASDSEKLQRNNTNMNKTNMNDTDISQSVIDEELEEIKAGCELHLFEEVDSYGNVNYQLRNLIENTIEIMYYSTSIKVDNAIIPQVIVRKKLKQLNGTKIFYALDKLKNNLKNTKNFSNSSKYFISCLYNAINEYFSDAEIQYEIDKN